MGEDDFKIVIAGLALLISVISLILSRKTSISNLQPVLVFVYDKDNGWILKNVGKGPNWSSFVTRIIEPYRNINASICNAGHE